VLPTPKKIKIVAGGAEGGGLLTSFDNALLKAGIGNVNLLRVTSILPPESEEAPDLTFPPGSLVPTAYGAISSDKHGELISAAVGIGFSHETFGVIMEYSGYCTREESEAKIRSMLEESFTNRNMELTRIKIKGVEHRVKKVATALAAVTLWY